MFCYFRHLRHRVAAGAAVACCFAGQGLHAQTPAEDEIDRPEVRDLKFRGVHSVDEDELRESLSTRESSCKSIILAPICLVYKGKAVYRREYLDRTEFKRDVLRVKVVYWRHGFRDAQVDTSVVGRGDKVRVRFTVREGPPTVVAALRIEGADSILTARELRRVRHLDAGNALDLVDLDSTVVLLRGVLAERGYVDAVVRPRTTVNDSARSAEVVITTEPRERAIVGPVNIQGDQKVEERVIRNALTFKEGDVYRPSEIARSQRALYELGLFRRATVGTPARPRTFTPVRRDTVVTDREPPLTGAAEAARERAAAPRDSVKPVRVVVEEAPPREARLGVGFNTVDFAQAEARLTHHNWFGDARRLDLQGVVGNILAPQLFETKLFNKGFKVAESDRAVYLKPTWQLSAQVQQRWFQDLRNTVGIGAFANRRSAPGIFVDRSFGGSGTFTRELADRLPASATYRFEVTQVSAGDVYFCVNFGVCETLTIDALKQSQRLSPFALTSTVDRTNNPLTPNRGYSGRLELEHASAATLSTFRYNRAFAEAAAYRPVRRRGILAGHLRLGWVGALGSTAEAVGLPEGTAERILVHPRKQFYAGGAQSVRGYAENQLGPRVLTIAPEVLRGRTITAAGDTNYRCAPEKEIQFCDPNAAGLADRDFQPRPLGAGSLVEGSVEFRFPIWNEISGAVFLDGAVLGASNLRDITSPTSSTTAGITGAVTPGFGFRYRSPVGPIRIDLGINPSPTEELPVITENDAGELRQLSRDPNDPTAANPERRYNPAGAAGRSWFSRAVNRLTLHLSIGEAY